MLLLLMLLLLLLLLLLSRSTNSKTFRVPDRSISIDLQQTSQGRTEASGRAKTDHHHPHDGCLQATVCRVLGDIRNQTAVAIIIAITTTVTHMVLERKSIPMVAW